MTTTLWQRFKLILEVVEVRLRFIAVLVVTGLLIGYWDTVKNYWDKWTRPAAAASLALAPDQEFYCPMHPQVTRSTYEPNGSVPNCPICGMPLSLRKRGEQPPLPTGVTARVQLSPERVQLAGVQTAEVAFRPLTRQLTAVGEVTYDESRLSRITSRSAGYIERLLVDKTYARVREGDPLAEIYSPDIYSGAQEFALLARRNMAPEMLEGARNRLRLLGVRDDDINNILTAGRVLPRITVRSPRTGYVIGKPVVTGSRVEEGMTLLEVADLSVVWIEADVFERDIGLLRVDQPIEATVEAVPGKKFHGRVALVYPRVEAATRTNRVRFEVQNPAEELHPGMFATVQIDVPLNDTQGKRHNVFRNVSQSQAGLLTVPERAVIDTGERRVVYVERQPGVFDGVEVKLGPRVGDYYPVLEGLKPGDRVAAAGAFLVDAETRLNPATAAAYFGASGGPQAARTTAAPAENAEKKESPPGPSAEDLKNIDKLPPEDRPLARAQRLCPITGEPLGSMGKPVKIVLRGQPVFLCCRGCVSEANRNADAVLKKVEQLRKGK
jgi:RND family efflux transporter MFP subunit